MRKRSTKWTEIHCGGCWGNMEYPRSSSPWFATPTIAWPTKLPMLVRGPIILMSWQYSTRMLTVTIPLPLVIDYIMRTAASGRKNGIFSLFWTVLVQINYLDFADDLALLSHHQRQMQDKNSINRSGNQDQSRQQKMEDHHHFPNTSRKCWWAHQSWTLHLPGKYGWHAKWPRPWHQAKNWQGKCCIYHA